MAKRNWCRGSGQAATLPGKKRHTTVCPVCARQVNEHWRWDRALADVSVAPKFVAPHLPPKGLEDLYGKNK